MVTMTETAWGTTSAETMIALMSSPLMPPERGTDTIHKLQNPG